MESLHPMMVHFPIALLMTAVLIELLALAWPGGTRPAWHLASLSNLGLGTLGAAAAVWTGRMAEAVAKHSPEIHEVMELHERLGYVALALAAAMLGWRLLRRDRMGRRARWLAVGVLAVACGVLAYGAHLGGRMVYEYGVGGSYGRSGGIAVIGHTHEH